mgnify:CR=1 FL=1
MISLLEGKLEFRGLKFAVINVNGIGYKIFAGAETLNKLPEKSSVVKIWTHQHVRENALELYGFITFPELDLFETLINVSGIGPKGALGILGTAPLDTLKKAIAAGDTTYLTRVSGIGRKTAEKIVLELKGILSEADGMAAHEEALDALKRIGYSLREAQEALRHATGETVEEHIKSALKILGKR